MAGVSDPNTVDVVAQDADGHYPLVMVEDRAWGSDPGQPMQLRERINAYAGFILNGEPATHYPETAGQPVRIQLDCIQQPTAEITIIIGHAQAKLAQSNGTPP